MSLTGVTREIRQYCSDSRVTPPLETEATRSGAGTRVVKVNLYGPLQMTGAFLAPHRSEPLTSSPGR